jgi:hypothetical protein
MESRSTEAPRQCEIIRLWLAATLAAILDGKWNGRLQTGVTVLAAQYSQITLGTLRQDLALSKRIRASAVRRSNLDLVDAENRRVDWLEQHIAYLEELAEQYAERQYQIEIAG